MHVKVSNISKTLFLHYYPAWIAWSAVYCFVFSSFNWHPRLTFTSLFFKAQLQVLFVYIVIIGSLYLLKPPNSHRRLVVIFSAMISAVIVWEAGSFAEVDG